VGTAPALVVTATIVLIVTTAWPNGCRGADASDTADQMPEILVTAQKRTERAQDIPMSLNVISAEDIDRTGARDFNDLLLSVPGVSYSGSQLGLSHFSIRGISTTAANPTVGIYFDDISLVTISTAFTGAIQPMPVDLERIEVLKGPQGTLYGGSAMGGALKYVSKSPVLNEFSVTASGEVASVDHGGTSYGGESFINLPLVDDHFALRIGGAYRYDAGYIDNIPNGQVQVWTQSATQPPAPFAPVSYPSQSQFSAENYNSISTTVARASARYASGDSFEIMPTATIQRTYQPNPDEFFTNLPNFENTNRFQQPTHDNFDIYSLRVTGSLPGVTITSLSGYVNRDNDLDGDFSLYIGMVTPAFLDTNSYNVSTTGTRTYSQEIRVAASDPNSSIRWTTGLYYSYQRDFYNQAIDTVGAGSFFADGSDITFATDTLTRTRQEALFGDLTYSPQARWDLSAGLRWFDIEQRIDGAGNGVYNGGPTEITDRRSTDVGVTPRFSVSYRLADGHMIYANAARGFRPGGPISLGTNSPECAPSLAQLGIEHAPSSYQSDSLWSYELGSKNEFLESRAILNAAVFYTAWKKIQQSIELNSCAMQFVGNIGAAKVAGAELSAEFPILRDLRAGGTVAYTETKVTQSAVGVDAQPGEELLDTPKSMDSLYADYARKLRGDWTGGLRADFEYHGRNLRQFSPVQSVSYPNGSSGEIPDATQVQAAYHVVNAGAYWKNSTVTCRLFVDNMLDAAPYLNFRRNPGWTAATTLRPRTIGIRLSTVL
jgi:iron complex outermembrane recepter protein